MTASSLLIKPISRIFHIQLNRLISYYSSPSTALNLASTSTSKALASNANRGILARASSGDKSSSDQMSLLPCGIGGGEEDAQGGGERTKVEEEEEEVDVDCEAFSALG